MNEWNGSHREQGMVLVITLILLFVMTLLAVSGMNTAMVEQILTTNYQSVSDAFSDAEVALVYGEKEIATNYSGTPLFDWSADTTDGLYNSGELVDVTTIWGSTGGYQVSPDGYQYAIEYLGPYTTEGTSITMGAGNASNRRYLFRVSGYGTGSRSGNRILQTVYATTD